MLKRRLKTARVTAESWFKSVFFPHIKMLIQHLHSDSIQQKFAILAFNWQIWMWLDLKALQCFFLEKHERSLETDVWMASLGSSQSSYSSWFNSLQAHKKVRSCKALRDFYWAQINWVEVKIADCSLCAWHTAVMSSAFMAANSRYADLAQVSDFHCTFTHQRSFLPRTT